MVTFRITLRNGALKDVIVPDESWFSMAGLHNYGLMYTERISPVRIFRQDGSIRDTFVNGSGYEVLKETK